MKRGYEFAKQHNVAPLKKFVGKAAPQAPRTSTTISPIHLFLVALLSFVIGVAMTLSMVSLEIVKRIQNKEVGMGLGFF